MASLFDGTEGMVDIAEILRQMEANVPHPSSTSRKLWTLRRAPHLAFHNRSRETMLEKAVAMLASNGHMPGWFNQCPTAPGIGGSSRTRRTNVDLVHCNEADGHARLIELKWDSDGPSEAMRQILRYGAAYLFCRMHRDRLPVGRGAVMEARDRAARLAFVAGGLDAAAVGWRTTGTGETQGNLANPPGFNPLQRVVGRPSRYGLPGIVP